MGHDLNQSSAYLASGSCPVLAKTYRSRHADATSGMAPGSDIPSEMSGLPPKLPVILARAKGELLTHKRHS